MTRERLTRILLAAASACLIIFGASSALAATGGLPPDAGTAPAGKPGGTGGLPAGRPDPQFKLRKLAAAVRGQARSYLKLRRQVISRTGQAPAFAPAHLTIVESEDGYGAALDWLRLASKRLGKVLAANPPCRDLGTFTASAYGPPWGGIEGSGTTASGITLDGPGYYIAVDPDVIALGSKVKVWPNQHHWRGWFIAADTGGMIQGARIDIYDWKGRSSQEGWGMRSVHVCVAR